MITDVLPTVPYVNSQILSKYTGRSVRLICRVDQVLSQISSSNLLDVLIDVTGWAQG